LQFAFKAGLSVAEFFVRSVEQFYRNRHTFFTFRARRVSGQFDPGLPIVWQQMLCVR